MFELELDICVVSVSSVRRSVGIFDGHDDIGNVEHRLTKIPENREVLLIISLNTHCGDILGIPTSERSGV